MTAAWSLPRSGNAVRYPCERSSRAFRPAGAAESNYPPVTKTPLGAFFPGQRFVSSLALASQRPPVHCVRPYTASFRALRLSLRWAKRRVLAAGRSGNVFTPATVAAKSSSRTTVRLSVADKVRRRELLANAEIPCQGHYDHPETSSTSDRVDEQESMRSKQIVIVGGSHGIGLGIVQRCVDAGSQVTVISRTAGELVDSDSVEHIGLDVSQAEITAEMLPGSIDGFVYCPGSINLAPLRGIKPDVLREDFELNVVAGLRSFQAALPGLKQSGSGSAVFFSSVAVTQGLPMHTSVAAAKGAVEGLVRCWAAELAPRVRVNAVAPSLTDTPLAAKFLSSDEKRKAMGTRHPLGRVGTVDDIAAAALFLLSDESSWVTGQILGVDGGMSALRT